MKTKHTLLLVLLLFPLFILMAQPDSIYGRWGGTLQMGKMRLPLAFSIERDSNGTGPIVYLDVPKQGLRHYRLETSFEADSLLLHVKAHAFGMEYSGRCEKDSIRGVFLQNGLNLPLTLGRTSDSMQGFRRPQTPKPPFSYHSEEVVFYNRKQDVSLSGTLTLPNAGYKGAVAVLVSGSGQQDRDETLFGHKPFLVWADCLTRAGIGVLRYDDRGVGGSTGDVANATSYDFSLDAEAAVRYLRKRGFSTVGIIGHSEGGMIAPMVAARYPKLGFIVLLAAPGIPCDSLLLLQQRAIAQAEVYPENRVAALLQTNRELYALLHSDMPEKTLKDSMLYLFRLSLGSDFPEDEFENPVQEESVRNQVNMLLTPWFRYFIGYKPASMLEKVKCPVLALNGSKDVQVLAGPNMEGIRKALEKAGNRNFSLEILPGLNHLFQQCAECTLGEYAEIEETVNEEALKTVASWVRFNRFGMKGGKAHSDKKPRSYKVYKNAILFLDKK